jgi:ubiquinone/menaquinone biosynthesis C-methylase UbiE
LEIATDQRKYFNRMADVFDTPQPSEVMDRLRQIVIAAELHRGEVVLDVGTGAGVLIPLIQRYQPSLVVACDLAEQMLAHVQEKYPFVLTVQGDAVWLPLKAATVDVVFMNAMYGNIADKPAACLNVSRVLRPGGRLVVSHPEGRGFIEQLRAAGDLFIESFPKQTEFQGLLHPLGFEMVTYRDEPKLYLMVARKT